ncbi:hypothetical protein BgiMline_026158 [Biomphalaria glabrata]
MSFFPLAALLVFLFNGSLLCESQQFEVLQFTTSLLLQTPVKQVPDRREVRGAIPTSTDQWLARFIQHGQRSIDYVGFCTSSECRQLLHELFKWKTDNDLEESNGHWG